MNSSKLLRATINKNSMASKYINITLKIWRQKNTNAKGGLETYSLNQVSTDMLNQKLLF